MNITSLIPEKYPYYLERFNRIDYTEAFENYFAECTKIFVQIDAAPGNADIAANKLIDYVEALIPKWFKRRLTFFDLKRFLFLYTVPAALKYNGEGCTSFVNALQAEWNAKYPDDILNLSSFGDIAGSFTTTIMGFQFGGNS